jgi:hypothetical protein
MSCQMNPTAGARAKPSPAKATMSGLVAASVTTLSAAIAPSRAADLDRTRMEQLCPGHGHDGAGHRSISRTSHYLCR